jgi:DNA (cytosine-5)-methyltransferase 1
LFAGPGGLGEGFASLTDSSGEAIFRIALSVEVAEPAFQTLRLRSFFRQFNRSSVPDNYYDALRGKLSIQDLYKRHNAEAEVSATEAWKAKLGGVSVNEVDQRIANAIGNSQRWILIGGPPCQAYSLVGRSRRSKPADREKYEKDEKHFLYKEYLRILAVHRPPVFVMENVKGILSSTVQGKKIIDQIVSDLRHPLGADESSPDTLCYDLHPLADYEPSLFSEDKPHPSDYIIKSELHGIPQARHRFIILGIRSDLRWTPKRLSNLSNSVSTWQAIGDLPPLRSRVSGVADSQESWELAIGEVVSKMLRESWVVDSGVAISLGRAALNLRKADSGGEFVEWDKKPNWRQKWLYDSRLGGVCNHQGRRHMKEDLWRYVFAAAFAAKNGYSPTLEDFPGPLLPEHRNVDAKRLREGDVPFADRFRVQLKNRPSTTVTSHIAKDGHYFIHPDPRQCRSLSVREAARLQTFPDDYFFLGTKTEQYQQVGNAVPPLLAYKIARVVAEMFTSVSAFAAGRL